MNLDDGSGMLVCRVPGARRLSTFDAAKAMRKAIGEAGRKRRQVKICADPMDDPKADPMKVKPKVELPPAR